MLVPGDNLASHFLGGYKAPSGALRKCRFCMTTYDEMNLKVSITSMGISRLTKLPGQTYYSIKKK